MNYYRDLFRTIANCNTPQCRCVNDEIRFFDYNFYFLNERRFNEFVELIEPVKKAYTPRSIQQVNMDPLVQRPFDTRTPALAEFVLKYDWANALSIHYYDEVQACLLLKNLNEVQEATSRCGGTNFVSANDTVIACVLKQYDCPIDVKNYMTLGFVVQLPDPNFDSIKDRITALTGNHALSSIRPLGSLTTMISGVLISSLLIYSKYF